MTKVINVSSLQRSSEEYDSVLRTLPFRDLRPRLLEMGFRFLSSDKELRQVNFERKGGIARPYTIGDETPTGLAANGLGRVKESILEPEWGFTSLVEDIMNYEDVNIVGNASEHVNPETKKHPHEFMIMSNVVKTLDEDLLDAIYFAERDEADASPLGLCDGINYLADALVSSGEISAAKGNLYVTGDIVDVTDETDTTPYVTIRDALRAANWGLKRGGAILKMSETLYYYVMNGLTNKLTYKPTNGFEVLQEILRGEANFPGLRVSVEPEMGTGTRFYLTKPDNFDFSLWMDASSRFVQVRNPFENPNLVQFWSQWKTGARIRVHHAKEFMMNNATAAGQLLSGDYYS